MADDVSDMRVDIGRMAQKMDSLTDTMREYIKRAEACQGDHETRLRAVEAATIAVAQIADLEARLAETEKTLAQNAGRDTTINYLVNGAIGAGGAVIGLIGGRL